VFRILVLGDSYTEAFKVQLEESGMREFHLNTGQYLHGFGSGNKGHRNQAGHRLAAELTFQYLKAQHMVPLESKTL